MRQHGIRKQVMAVTVVLLMAFAAGELLAQQSAYHSRTTGAQKEQSRGGPQEGIKVHGHWTIMIKNPDGSVASRRDFENSLTSTGPDFLASALARTGTVGLWMVQLLPSPTGTGACGGVTCGIGEAAAPTVVNGSNNLSVSFATNPSRTVLQGSLQAANGGEIAQVTSFLALCSPSVAPTACPGTSGIALGFQSFSSRTFSAMTVQAGQIVQVTVTYTFS